MKSNKFQIRIHHTEKNITNRQFCKFLEISLEKEGYYVEVDPINKKE
jgi:hypothetical protein